MVEYFEYKDVPGRYFVCPSGYGTLSDKACARNFSEATSAKSRAIRRMELCDGCETGAAHAGVTEIEVRRDAGLVCARCEKPATRLIRGSVCVSCYNREREVLIGKNAKGQVPVRCSKLYQEMISVVARSGRLKLCKLDRVVSGKGEAMRTIIAQEGNPVYFVETVPTPDCLEPQGDSDTQPRHGEDSNEQD